MSCRRSLAVAALLHCCINLVNPALASPLHDAVTANDAAALQVALAATKDINERDGDESSALFLAAEKGRIDLVKLLLDKGANIEAGGSNGRSPLMVATAGGHLDVMELLLSRGADKECSSHKGAWTCLMDAAWYKHEDAARLLIAKGADIHKRNEDGSTALSLAAGMNGNVALVRYLIDLGADFQAPDNYGFTPLFRARQTEDAAIEALLNERIARVAAGQDARDPLPTAEADSSSAAPAEMTDDEQAQSDTLYCIGVYAAIGNQASIRDSLEGATALAARDALIQRFARLVNSTPDNREAVLDRVDYAEKMLQDMLDEGESLSEMLDECNEAFELDIKGG